MSSVKKQLIKSSAPTFSDTTATGWVITVEDGANYSISVGGGNDTIYGGAGNDLLVDGGNGQGLYGGAGRDTLLGYTVEHTGSNRILNGGDGNDLVASGGGSNVVLVGEAGNDTLLGFDLKHESSGSALVFDGGSGNDSIGAGWGSNDTVYGGQNSDSGNDTLLGYYDASHSGQSDQLFGGAGDDLIATGAGNGDVVDGGDGADTIFGCMLKGPASASNLQLSGGAGNDSIVAGAGSNNAVYGDYGAVSTVAGDDTLLGYVNLTSFGSHDSLYGGFGNDVLASGRGAGQLLYGGGGNDKLLAGTITSSSQYQMSAVGVYVDGGDGNDTTFGGFGADTVSGGAGADYINYSGSGGLLDGGSGVDTLDLGGYAYGFHVVGADTAPGSTYFTGIGYSKTVTEGTFSFKNFEVLIGSAYADTVAAVAGLDTIVAGQGNDYVYANGDAESLAGGTGNDTLDFSTPVNAANIDLAAGTATIAGNTVSFSGFESIVGTRADDLFIYTMNPSNSNESIAGGTAGNDTLKLFKIKTTHYVMGTSIGSGVDFVIKYDDGSTVPAATHDSTGSYSLTNSHAGTITFSDNHTLHSDASIEHIAW